MTVTGVDMSHWVFAYGSNMHLEDLRRWLENQGYSTAGIRTAEPAVVLDYRLVWNYFSVVRNGAAANAEPYEGAELLGVALAVDDATLAALDIKEGHPKRYRRDSQPVSARLLKSGSRVEAWLYRAQPEHLRSSFVPPRRGYIQLMIKAAEQQGLPAEYIGALRKVPTVD